MNVAAALFSGRARPDTLEKRPSLGCETRGIFIVLQSDVSVGQRRMSVWEPVPFPVLKLRYSWTDGIKHSRD